MSKIHIRQHRFYQSEKITDYAHKILDTNYQKARYFKVTSALDGLAQIYIPNGISYIVNLTEHTCTCGEFQEFLIPYCHAIVVCLWQTIDPYLYIHEWYSVDYYRQIYSCFMHPIWEEDLIEEFDNCIAPKLAKQKGRPKKQRIRRNDSESRTVICGHCKQAGHNRRSCRHAYR